MAHFLWSKKLFLFLFPIALLGQVQKKDLTLLPYKTIDDNYFEEEGNYQKQLAWSNVYLEKAQKENKSIRKARGYYLVAILYYTDKPYKAIQYLDSVIKYSKIEPNKFFPAAAYCEKADILVNQRKFDEALRNYNLAEQATLKTNIDYYYVVRNSIGTTKSEELGEVGEALKLYQECFNYYRTKEFRGDYYSWYYQNIIFGIADCHKALKNSDSTTFYNKLGYKEATITKNKKYQLMFVLNEGANEVDKKNYTAALDSINKVLPELIKIKNTGNVLASYYYSGKAYAGLGNTSKAVQNFIKVDSMYKIKKRITPEFISGYSYLIDYYKKTGDKEKQLQYITTFMSIDSVLQKNYKHLNKVLLKEYDTPHLFAEKENLIQSLKKKQTTSYFGILVLLLLVIAIGGFGGYQYYLKKQYRKRFDAIVFQVPIEHTNNLKNEDSKIVSEEIAISESTEVQTKRSIENKGIAEELVTQILEKLKDFEIKKGYLESNITVQMLSTTFGTNSKYISKIVNTYKSKTFIQYINDLRIENAIVKLQQDKKLRNYTIQALALEFGFNNAESFSAAFHKKTGIKPTYFIKELG
jgi:AraC-like DNA-binding protein